MDELYESLNNKLNLLSSNLKQFKELDASVSEDILKFIDSSLEHLNGLLEEDMVTNSVEEIENQF
jgi:hypothetical protein